MPNSVVASEHKLESINNESLDTKIASALSRRPFAPEQETALQDRCPVQAVTLSPSMRLASLSDSGN